MIDYTYQPNWNTAILTGAANTHSNVFCYLQQKCPNLHRRQIIQLVQNIIETIINAFDHDGSLHGLFNLLSSSNKRVSPFIATRDYRMRVESCQPNGHIELTISPIYRLGPDYPDRYKRQYGKALAKEAIIGLIESPVVELTPNGQHAYLLGIDAGMAFKDSKIPHMKSIRLKLTLNDQSVTAALECESETMSKTLPWQEIAMPAANDQPPHEELAHA